MGSKEKVFTAGSEMQLVCIVRDITQAPSYIFWCLLLPPPLPSLRYHNARMINYDTLAGVEVVVSALASRTLRSSLTIHRVALSHSGTYSCSPSQVTSPPSPRQPSRSSPTP